MNSLRDNVKDAIREYAEKHLIFCDPDDTAYEIADAIFEAMGIDEHDQDKENAKIAVSPRRVYLKRRNHTWRI